METAAALMDRFNRLLKALKREDEGSFILVDSCYRADRHGGASPVEAILDCLHTTVNVPDPDTGAPYSAAPVEVPASLVEKRDSILADAAEHQALADQVEASEAAAGWSAGR